MSAPPSQRRTRVYVACQNCRRRKIKCATDDTEYKPCQRCLHKGLLCEYFPVSDRQQHAASSDSPRTHSSRPQPTKSGSRVHSAAKNHPATHSECPQSMSLTLYTLRSDRAASTLNHRYGDQRTLPGSSSYCFPETQIHEERSGFPARQRFEAPGELWVSRLAHPAAQLHNISSPLYCAKCPESTTHLPSQWIGCFQTTLGKSNSTNELTPRPEQAPEIDSLISEKFATPRGIDENLEPFRQAWTGDPIESSPPEVRGIIFNFCFPPPQNYVQIVPYRTSFPACRLNLPLALYLVCKLITSELGPLPAKLRRLDLTYIIHGPSLYPGWRPEHGGKDDDYDHFPSIMRFAERVRLVGAGPLNSRGHLLVSVPRLLQPGPQCALKVLEVQPRVWSKVVVGQVMLNYLRGLTTHPDVAGRLEVRLIRDADDPLGPDEEVKAVLQAFQARMPSFDLAKWEGREGEPNVDMEKIEAWLKRFQDVEDVNQRSDFKGPLASFMTGDV
ncbi:hypothetical protein B0H14DRAFT_3760051 [Mycena olivaceomarginata]|nr:hypothetical protein B0H14DRAFT_3760051 [Mycena olivaceomarginata]